MIVHVSRMFADDYDQASARIWDKFPNAIGIIIMYMYCGWYEYTVLEQEGVIPIENAS